MPRAKKKKIPEILNTPIERPDYNYEFIWNMLVDEYSVLDKQFKDRERALCDYLEVPYVDIKQPEVRKMLHKLAIAYGMKGFKYRG
ncbi:hypothetical protein AGMMS50222_03980 [Endomicrobiia bacterium]|nr:hypothetical protein AGMMS50222_03980 [Endomicrobiia bacterium]